MVEKNTTNEQVVPPMAENSHREQSIIVVKNYTIGALAPALIPVPLFDLVALVGIQLKMLHDLSAVYNVEFSAELSRAAVTSLISSVLPVAAAHLAGSLVKFIPGVGQAAGVASMLILGGAFTHALGMVFVKHFEEGGDFTNFDIQAAKGYFKVELEKGKKIAAELNQRIVAQSSMADKGKTSSPDL